MKNSKDHAAEPENATTDGQQIAFSQNASRRKCQMFCRSTQGGEPVNIDLKLTSACIEAKSPEEYYAQEICKLTGAENRELADHIIDQGISALSVKNRAVASNIVFQTLAEQRPKDPHEARLSMQAMALYTQGMKYLCRSEQEDRIPQCEFYVKNAMKLLRLHNETIEVLNKHRRDGEQRVVVQHVQVNDGGQAIVGSVLNGGRGQQSKNNEVPHGYSSDM